MLRVSLGSRPPVTSRADLSRSVIPDDDALRFPSDSKGDILGSSDMARPPGYTVLTIARHRATISRITYAIILVLPWHSLGSLFMAIARSTIGLVPSFPRRSLLRSGLLRCGHTAFPSSIRNPRGSYGDTTEGAIQRKVVNGETLGTMVTFSAHLLRLRSGTFATSMECNYVEVVHPSKNSQKRSPSQPATCCISNRNMATPIAVADAVTAPPYTLPIDGTTNSQDMVQSDAKKRDRKLRFKLDCILMTYTALSYTIKFLDRQSCSSRVSLADLQSPSTPTPTFPA